MFSNPFPHPRWGQGAFRTSLEALYTTLTKDPLPLNITQFGKPSAATFSYAENVLMNYLDEWHGVSRLSADGTRTVPRRVYMFGDNPESGIPLGNTRLNGQIFVVQMNMDGIPFLSEREISRARGIVPFILQGECLMMLDKLSIGLFGMKIAGVRI